MGIWDNVGEFERNPKLTDELKEVGTEAEVVFEDDGKEVKAERIAKKLEEAGKKNVKAKDSFVFVVKRTDNDEKRELWINSSNYSSLNELKAIRDENENSMIGAKVKVARVSENDLKKSSFNYTKVE